MTEALQPPVQNALSLTPPEPVAAVPTTSAPSIAPKVPEQALPGLEAKVDGYLASLLQAEARSPEFAAKANDIRTMGDADIRSAADSSNRRHTAGEM